MAGFRQLRIICQPFKAVFMKNYLLLAALFCLTFNGSAAVPPGRKTAIG